MLKIKLWQRCVCQATLRKIILVYQGLGQAGRLSSGEGSLRAGECVLVFLYSSSLGSLGWG